VARSSKLTNILTAVFAGVVMDCEIELIDTAAEA
jgi:hypothetical protein